ncbi:MAG: hypothetical protein PHY16_20140 [Methylobacter sp.]|nr:hypothetical protein [Methylobacter sp.]
MARRRYRRKSLSEDLFDMLFELTGFVWQIGAAVTGALLFFSYLSYDWAAAWIATAEKSPVLSAIAANFGWVAYLLPLMLIIFAVLFGAKTYDTYRNGHHF